MARKAEDEKRKPSAQSRERADEVRRIAGRAIRRLNILEYVILLAAVLVALLGGVVVAWVLMTVAGLPFRATWAVSSLLLFIIPGGSVYLRELRRGKKERNSGSNSESKGLHG